METRTIAITLMMLVAGLAIGCSGAPEAPSQPSQNSSTVSDNKTGITPTNAPTKPNATGAETTTKDVGKDVNSFEQRVHPRQQDNEESCPGCNLVTADLSEANLAGANLTGTVLMSANLTEADLTGAEMKSVYLVDASLFGADLTRADLSGANVGKVIGADFTGAINVPAK